MTDPWATYEPSDEESRMAATDAQMQRYYDVLETIDALGRDVTGFEATFLERVLTTHRYLSEKEQAIVQQMAWTYLQEEL